MILLFHIIISYSRAAETRPFRPGEIQPHLEADDCPNQDDIVHNLNDDERRRKDFDKLYRTKYTLNSLRSMVDQKDIRKAERVLSQRSRVIFEEGEFIKSVADPMITWDMRTHYLDHLCIVPTQPGLDVILPPRSESGITWEWRLDLRRRMKQFSGEKSKLGFDPVNRMLWAGTCMGMDVWIAMVARPDALFVEDKDGDRRGFTTMSVEIYFVVLIFMSSVLRQLGTTHIDLYNREIHNNYPPLPGNRVEDMDIERHTNIL
jgi:hypothetical protein